MPNDTSDNNAPADEDWSRDGEGGSPVAEENWTDDELGPELIPREPASFEYAEFNLSVYIKAFFSLT